MKKVIEVTADELKRLVDNYIALEAACDDLAVAQRSRWWLNLLVMLTSLLSGAGLALAIEELLLPESAQESSFRTEFMCSFTVLGVGFGVLLVYLLAARNNAIRQCQERAIACMDSLLSNLEAFESDTPDSGGELMQRCRAFGSVKLQVSGADGTSPRERTLFELAHERNEAADTSGAERRPSPSP